MDGWEGLLLDGWELNISYGLHNSINESFSLAEHEKTLRVPTQFRSVGFARA